MYTFFNYTKTGLKRPLFDIFLVHCISSRVIQSLQFIVRQTFSSSKKSTIQGSKYEKSVPPPFALPWHTILMKFTLPILDFSAFAMGHTIFRVSQRLKIRYDSIPILFINRNITSFAMLSICFLKIGKYWIYLYRHDENYLHFVSLRPNMNSYNCEMEF